MKRVRKTVIFLILTVSLLVVLGTFPKTAGAKSVIASNDTYTQLNNPWASYTSFNYTYKSVPNNYYLTYRSYGNLGSKWWNWKYVSHYR